MLYVSKLGISALIREAMSANDAWELGRLCHRHGGNPVGSIVAHHASLRPCLPGALFMDCTHDNEMPTQKRTTEDSLPNSALVGMAVSAVGSVRGYDELYSKQVHVVRETRVYPVWKENQIVGITPVKARVNALHKQMAIEGYSEIHVHQENNVITIQRHRPATHEAFYCVAHTAFTRSVYPANNIRVPGIISEFLFASSLSNVREGAAKDTNTLYGLSVDLDFAKGIFSSFAQY